MLKPSMWNWIFISLGKKVVAKKIVVQFVPSQTTDILTKPLTFDQFHYLRSKLNVHPGQFSLRGDVTKHG